MTVRDILQNPDEHFRFVAYLDELQHVADADEVDLVSGVLSDPDQTMAMSRDRGTAAQAQDQGYGLVTDMAGHLIPNLVMTAASQEHGTLTARDGTDLPDLPVGTRLRILPNHACATAAQHHGYHVVDSSKGTEPAPVIHARWPRITGW